VITADSENIDASELRKEAALAALAVARQARVDELAPRVAAVLRGHETITLELGCGHGHFLDGYSTAHPDEFCIGIDLVTKRIEKGAKKHSRGGQANLAFMKAEATEFLDALPESVKLAKIFFLFPDPWPKKRHFRYRMVRPDMLDRLAKRAPIGAKLHFRSDHTEYFDWATEHLNVHPAWRIEPALEWPFECATFFSELLPVYQSMVAVRV
jgi:tRNA (guanine-N7-)-methyltransferase